MEPEVDIPLWDDVPAASWFRQIGRTRVVLIDDQLTDRSRLLDVEQNAPLTADEMMLREKLNVDLQFFPKPDDYSWTVTDEFPKGTFSEEWFEQGLFEIRKDPRPIAAILLDLLFGREASISEASGRRFLDVIRRQLPDVPVLILSSVSETHEVRERLKSGSDTGHREERISFQDYLPKRDPSLPERPLLQRLHDALLEWGDLSDPTISAFSASMRRAARQMRQVVLWGDRVDYEVPSAGSDAERARMPRPVTFAGEYGSGKNYLAHRLVQWSTRRNNPYHTINFAAMTGEGVVTSLFGSHSYTDAVQCSFVDPEDGAVVAQMAVDRAKNARGLDRYLKFGQLGRLHLADIAEQAVGSRRLLQGTVLLDELGAASGDMQTTLLGVFNNGRFVPHLGNIEIPTRRHVDVWFLITESPELGTKIREDLRGRLSKGVRVTIPPLSRRIEDAIPLVLARAPEPTPGLPGEILTAAAQRWLLENAPDLQVRDIVAILETLPNITAKRPYSAGEVEAAYRLSRESVAPRSVSSVPSSVAEQIAPPASPWPQADVLTLLREWNEQVLAPLPKGDDAKKSLENQGALVDGASAAVRLAYLDRALYYAEFGGDFSVTRACEYMYGVKNIKTNTARTRLGSILEADHAQTLKALRRSDLLLRAAVDIAKRQAGVAKILDNLAKESDQVRRLRECGYRQEE